MIRLTMDTLWAMALPTLLTAKISRINQVYGELWYGRGAIWAPDPTGWVLVMEVVS